MNLPKPQYSTFSFLLNDIERGIIKIPQFQRNFVWSMDKAANLMDSMLKGYPIGTFIFWKTKERLRSIRNLGGIEMPEPPTDDYIQYVLDGQQRLTSVFVTLKGLKITREDTDEDFSQMYIDLLANENEKIVITDISEKNPKNIIKLTELIFGGLTLLAALPNEHHKKLEEYKQRINSYSFPTVLVDDVSIEVATEIFARINEGGKGLSVFEIMVAKTFDIERNFDLKEKYDEFILKVMDVDYETISDSTILQCLASILKKECSKKVILQLDKVEFINIWSKVINSIEIAIEYFRGYYRIPVSELLPYNALIVPFSYYFFHHKDKPNGIQQKYLQDFFWRTSLSERYSHSLETKLSQDITRIDSILNNKCPNYDYPVEYNINYIIENGTFSVSRSYIKAILCLYAYQQPKSFGDNSIVHISNDWLKQANSKNYHHFFPKSFMKNKDFSEQRINNVLNITIVDEHLNKREIGKKAPSKYMCKFKEENDNLHQTMETHLINDIDGFGIWNDDYEKFISKRAELVSKEIEKRILK